MNNKIIESVDKCIEIIGEDFEDNPSLFFTENDIVCYFYKLLQDNLPIKEAVDKDGCKHFLVHGEYPTPFKCDMRNDSFGVKDNDSPHKRGHYDIVVLSPDFIEKESYAVIKAQNFSSFKDKASSCLAPIVLYGLEFMCARDALKSEEQINSFVKKVNQDAEKLVASCNGFMKKAKMLVFVKDREEQVRQKLKEEIKVFFGKDRSK